MLLRNEREFPNALELKGGKTVGNFLEKIQTVYGLKVVATAEFVLVTDLEKFDSPQRLKLSNARSQPMRILEVPGMRPLDIIRIAETRLQEKYPDFHVDMSPRLQTQDPPAFAYGFFYMFTPEDSIRVAVGISGWRTVLQDTRNVRILPSESP